MGLLLCSTVRLLKVLAPACKTTAIKNLATEDSPPGSQPFRRESRKIVHGQRLGLCRVKLAALQVVHGSEAARRSDIRTHEAREAPVLGDLTMVEIVDEVGLANGVEAMRDQDDGLAGGSQVADLREDVLFGLRVERGGGFVDDEDVAGAVTGAGDGEFLPLAA